MPDIASFTRLADLVSVRGKFLRSVHLERDFHQAAPNGYHLTECAAHTLNAIVAALEQPSERAMMLVGPYGAGKSAFCVYIAQLLEPSPSASGWEMLERTNPTLHRRLSAANPKLLPVLVVGSRQPLANALVTGLAQALQRAEHCDLLYQLQQEMGAIFEAETPAPRAVAELYERAACHAQLAGAEGIFLIVDEFGKFLEYAALHPKEGDILALQEIAEAASRSKGAPLVTLTVLHQNADAYAQKLGRTHQAEWAKVGERLRQLLFFPSDFERIDMVGKALQQAPALCLNGHMDRLSRGWTELDVPHMGMRERFIGLANAAYPLHPITLLALPALFRKAGQSHRSLFNFLSAEEAHALGHFLRETGYDPQNPPLFSLDRLFDYAAEILIGGWSGAGLARLWAEAVESVERAVNVSPLAKRVLKCIALLGLLKDPRLPATRDLLELALADCRPGHPNLSEALNELKKRRLIVHSRMHDTYRLWEGGDVDVEAEIANARATLPAGTTLHVATTLCPPPRLIARRHSYETGTLRTVGVRPCAAERLEATLNEAARKLNVVFCLAATPDEAATVEEKARTLSAPYLLVAVALETEMLRDSAADIAAGHRVKQEADGIDSDRAARRELAARQTEAEAAFRQEWERLFGPHPGGANWFYRGEPLSFSDSREFSAFLSRMADDSYPNAPRLRNELINRHALSSAAAAGRRNLIEAMLTSGTLAKLGIKQFPPEMSMYECLLRASGIHVQDAEGRWGYAKPPHSDPARLLPCWEALERIVFADPPEPRPLSDLFETLKSMPFGITDGVLPVVLCAFLLVYADETTLYREGTFIPEPGVADWEVLMRRPELFAVAGCRVTGERAAVVNRLACGLNVPASVIPIVRGLLKMVRGLPEHAWKTRYLPENVLEMRNAFEKARSPERLLFHDLPAAVGITFMVEEEVGPGNVDDFFAALNTTLNTWGQATQNAILNARDTLLEACGLPKGEDGFATLRKQALRLSGQVMHTTLLPFLRRAAETGDDQTVLESVLALVANRPPRTWTDTDIERFPAQAQVMGNLFRQAQEDTIQPVMTALPEDDARQRDQLVQHIRAQINSKTPQHVLRAALLTLLSELDV